MPLDSKELAWSDELRIPQDLAAPRSCATPLGPGFAATVLGAPPADRAVVEDPAGVAVSEQPIDVTTTTQTWRTRGFTVPR